MTPRIGIIGLGEAGNLGDDLILIATAGAVGDAVPDAVIRHLSSGFHVDWEMLPGPFRLAQVEPVRKPRDLPGSARAERTFLDSDAVLFGGGGLLQDVHHPYRPYHWLRFLPSAKVPTLGVGLGLGPLSDRWTRWFAGRPMPLDACFVRDEQSGQLARGLGWRVERCHDFVDSGFLDLLVPDARATASTADRLGVSLRVWPGLRAADVAASITSLARKRDLSEAVFYVLEHRDRGADEAFTRQVRNEIGTSLATRVQLYRARDLMGFLHDLAQCRVAFSMKLHASILWAHFGTDVYPLIYAPKVAALFGRPYRGLEIVDEPTEAAWFLSKAPRAQEVVSTWLLGIDNLSPTDGTRFSRHERTTFQVKSLAVDSRSALRSRIQARQP